MKNLLLAPTIMAVLFSSAAPVLAQQHVNPKELPKVTYYMARQQIQITDDAPAVNDMRTNPQAAQQGPAAAPPSVRQPLPRAGFMSNMGAYHAGPSGGALPQVSNGVPRSLPQTINGLPNQNGMKAGNAGRLSVKKPPTVKQPPVAKSYRPYATTPVAQSGGNSGGSMLNSSTNVHGSVLHWNRKH